MKYAILGGTFDPIHIGHLIAGEQVADALGIEKVIFIPSGNPPHKNQVAVTDAEDRYNMTALAVGGNSRFEVSRMEIERTGPSYSIDTIRWFNRQYGRDQVGFIIGVDALAEVGTWHDCREVMREANFLVIHRPGYSLDSLECYVSKEWLQSLHFVEMVSVDVSSTQIRNRVRQGRSIRYLTPDAVIAYIKQNHLYLD